MTIQEDEAHPHKERADALTVPELVGRLRRDAAGGLACDVFILDRVADLLEASAQIMRLPASVEGAVFASWTRAEQDAYAAGHRDARHAAAELAAAAEGIDSSDRERLLYSARVLRGIADLGRDKPLGDLWVEAVNGCGAIKRVLSIKDEDCEALGLAAALQPALLPAPMAAIEKILGEVMGLQFKTVPTRFRCRMSMSLLRTSSRTRRNTPSPMLKAQTQTEIPMNNDDYLLKRLGALEYAMRSLMATARHVMPSLADSISRIEWQWDEELDAITAERAAGAQPPATQKPPCRNQGGVCSCRSGGSFGGCALERAGAA